MALPPHRWTARATEAPGAVLAWLQGWYFIVRLGAMLAALALTPATYSADQRARVLREIYRGSAPGLPWFTLLSSLMGLVLIRIVTVTAVSYGLTQYALEMVVRVLVLELIPLSAALFVALRYTLPQRAELSRMRRAGQLSAVAAAGGTVDARVLLHELLPRVVSGVFAVLSLAAVSCVVSLLIAYLSVYGFTPWAFEAYARVVGSIFHPAVTLIFVLKTLGFSLSVALIPVASALYDAPRTTSPGSAELRALVRMFVVLLAIELLSLMGNYA
jgi:phospholipid/cholesterol/gamma-HCH transport system permease protein